MPVEFQEEKMKCKVCFNTQGNIPHLAKELLYGIDEVFSYYECVNCGCIQIREIPELIEKYYPSDYHCYMHKNSNNPLINYCRVLRNRYAVFGRNLLGKIFYQFKPQEALNSLKYVSPQKSWRILDVGCGGGALINFLGEMGFNNTIGIDPFIGENVFFNNGAKIFKKYLYEVEGKWDLIMLHHSLEHFPDQKETLIKISELLNENGNCLIRIPISTSFAWEHYGTNWIGFDAPRHLFIHSIKSLSLLAEKSGLLIKKIVFDSSEMQFWASEQSLRGIHFYASNSYYINKKNSIFSRMEIKKYRKMAQKFNLENRGDQAIFILQKQN